MKNSNSKGKEIQKKNEVIPGGIIPLLKPIRSNPFSASPKLNCFMVTVIRTKVWTNRYFFNLSRHPKQLPNVLATILVAVRCSSWHNFFVLMPSREFMQWRYRFPMAKIKAIKDDNLECSTDPAASRKKSIGSGSISKKKMGRKQNKRNKSTIPRRGAARLALEKNEKP
ncbi:hypothetical protein KR200_010545 [Drosophila serrata]|nr:hypothetical protein KR200_010545 [Drosophila serrata]